jgi:hypothetical protein
MSRFQWFLLLLAVLVGYFIYTWKPEQELRWDWSKTNISDIWFDFVTRDVNMINMV